MRKVVFGIGADSCQGLVPLLEFIACGVPISSRTRLDVEQHVQVDSRFSSFPERKVRLWAKTTLRALISHYQDKTVFHNSVLALVNSESTRLRLNILSSIVYLSSCDSMLSRYVHSIISWNIILIFCVRYVVSTPHRASLEEFSENISTSSFLPSLCTRVIKNRSDLKSLLTLLYHFLGIGLDYFKMQHDPCSCDGFRKDRIETDDNSSIIVIIEDDATMQGIKMTCPPFYVIENHSTKLASVLQVNEPSRCT